MASYCSHECHDENINQVGNKSSPSDNLIYATKHSSSFFDSKIDIFISRKKWIQSIFNAEFDSDPFSYNCNLNFGIRFLTEWSESACRTVSHFLGPFNSCTRVSRFQIFKIRSDVKVACVEFLLIKKYIKLCLRF